jgi:hypothetical protein
MPKIATRLAHSTHQTHCVLKGVSLTRRYRVLSASDFIVSSYFEVRQRCKNNKSSALIRARHGRVNKIARKGKAIRTAHCAFARKKCRYTSESVNNNTLRDGDGLCHCFDVCFIILLSLCSRRGAVQLSAKGMP